MSDANSRFSYYSRLSAKNKAIYRRSDAIVRVILPSRSGIRTTLHEAASAVADALDAHKPSQVRQHAQRLCDAITEALDTEPVVVKVLRVRPQRSYGELHGLYTRDDGKPPTIRVWMRTAHRADVVRPRTFLRTLMHEVCHHLDYTHYRLGDSFHNPGFFKRESSLMRLMADPSAAASRPVPSKERSQEPAQPAGGEAEPPEALQLRLEF